MREEKQTVANTLIIYWKRNKRQTKSKNYFGISLLNTQLPYHYLAIHCCGIFKSVNEQHYPAINNPN